ncbi:MAG: hypothetical protein AB8F78_01585 [Saprospiraceae bacterium]
MKISFLLFLLSLLALSSNAQLSSEEFTFEFEGTRLNGILDIPEGITPKGLVLIVQGSGIWKTG